MSRPGPNKTETETRDGGMGKSRVRRVAEAFSSVADAFDADVDALVFAGRLTEHCVELTAVGFAGLMLVDVRGELRTVGSSDRRVEVLDRFQARTGEGPCVHAWRTGELVRDPRLELSTERWPQYTALATDLGVRGVYALPVNIRDEPVGALNLLLDDALEIPADDLVLAASLAGVAVGSMLRWQADPLRPSDVATRVQSVISSRAAVETAIGMLVARPDTTVAVATRALEEYARRNGTGPGAVAQDLLRRSVTPQEVLGAAVPRLPDGTGAP